MTMRGELRVGVRLARRRASTQRTATALLVVLASLPLAALDIGLIAYASSPRNPLAYARASVWESADARLALVQVGPIQQDLTGASEQSYAATESGSETLASFTRAVEDTLPAGSNVAPAAYTRASLQTGTKTTEPLRVEATGMGVIAAGSTRSGRFPAGATEAALTPALAERLDLRIGDHLVLDTGTARVSAEVVGILRPSSTTEAVIGWEGLPEDWLPTFPADRRVYGWYVWSPQLNWASVEALNVLGVAVTSPQLISRPATSEELYVQPANSGGSSAARALLTVVILIVTAATVALLVGPAFGIVMQRSKHELALLSAAGGGARSLRAVVLSSGVLVGAAAAAVAPTVAIAIAWLWHAAWGIPGAVAFTVPTAELATVSILGVLFCLAASALPAVSVARVDVVAALVGRVQSGGTSRGPARLRALVVPMTGLMVLGYGALSAQLIVTAIGSLLLLAGLILAGGAILRAMAGIVAQFGLPARLAVRDAVRHPRRTSPTVTLMLVATCLAVGVAATAESAEGAARRSYIATLPHGMVEVTATPALGSPSIGINEAWSELESEASAILGVRPAVPVESPVIPGDTYLPGQVRVLSDAEGRPRMIDLESVTIVGVTPAGDILSLLGVVDGDAAAAALAGGAVVVSDPSLLKQDATPTLTLEVTRGEESLGDPVEWPVYLAEAAANVSIFVVPGQLAEAVGLEIRTTSVVFGALGDTLPSQEDELRSRALRLFGAQTDVHVYVERGYQAGPEIAAAQAASTGAAILALLVAWAATALSTTEQRGEIRVLEAVGLDPSGRLRLVAAYGGVVAACAVTAGAAAGLMIAAGLTLTMNQNDSLWRVSMPWPALAMSVLLVPAVATVGAIVVGSREGERVRD